MREQLQSDFDKTVKTAEISQEEILIKKDLYNKEDIKKISFSKSKTENQLSKKSFVESFLSSIKEKMYGNRWVNIFSEQ